MVILNNKQKMKMINVIISVWSIEVNQAKNRVVVAKENSLTRQQAFLRINLKEMKYHIKIQVASK